jgi:hypothetical protein
MFSKSTAWCPSLSASSIFVVVYIPRRISEVARASKREKKRALTHSTLAVGAGSDAWLLLAPHRRSATDMAETHEIRKKSKIATMGRTLRLAVPLLTVFALFSLAQGSERETDISCSETRESNDTATPPASQELIVWLTTDDKDGARLSALHGVNHLRRVFGNHVHAIASQWSCSQLQEANDWIKDCRQVDA